MNKLVFFILVLMLPLFPVDAQQAIDTDAFPTVAALENTIIPPRDRVELAQRLRGVESIPPAPENPPARQVGERDVFYVTDSSADRSFEVPAILRVIGDHIYLWVEEGANVRDEDLQALADGFDTRIYDQARELWGSEASPGIDGDPRVHGLFARGLGMTTAAYVTSDHGYPDEAVPTSNEREMFFFNLDAIGTDIYLPAIEGVVAHEFQHMIRNNLQINEETWMNEGFSEFTQLYLYGQPDSTIFSFLTQPGTQLNSWNEASGARMANYGAALMFLTYFYDRYGIDAMKALSADMSPRGLQSVDNVLRAMGEPGVDVFFADWVLANTFLAPDSIYGYDSLPPLGMTASLASMAIQYPFTYADIANQYGTDYIQLPIVEGVKALDIRFEIPDVVSLIAAEGDGHFLYSNRGDMSNTHFTRAFDLTGVTSATLNYRLWYHIERLWDYGYVMISDDGGETWDIIATEHTTTENPHHTAYGAGYTGVSGGGAVPAWVEESVSLDAYAGREILVRFEMITDDAVNQAGMAVDDVRIDAIGYAEDFESGDGGWLSEGWIITDNRLPQYAWVQAVQRVGGELVVTRWQPEATVNEWTLDLVEGADTILLAISPFAPVTTVPTPYRLVAEIR